MQNERLTELIAFVAEDVDGNEGLVAMYSSAQGCWIPMVFSNNMKSLRDAIEHAQDLARESRRPIKVLRFYQRTEVSRIEP